MKRPEYKNFYPKDFINGKFEAEQEKYIDYLEDKFNNVDLANVIPSAYLMNIDNEATVVMAANISSAVDKAEKVADKSYEMVYSKSLDVLH